MEEIQEENKRLRMTIAAVCENHKKTDCFYLPNPTWYSFRDSVVNKQEERRLPEHRHSLISVCVLEKFDANILWMRNFNMSARLCN